MRPVRRGAEIARFALTAPPGVGCQIRRPQPSHERTPMKIRIGQEFPVPPSRQASRPGDFYALTRGSHGTGVNANRGIFYYAALKDPNGVSRIPAFLLYSNNLRSLSEKNPWLDVMDADAGYALYHGDNRTPGSDPYSADGNRRVLEVAHQYTDPDLRTLAPPMILFESAAVPGSSASYRRLAGYGLPRELRIQSQRSERGTFTNLVIELVLFSLTEEGECLNWDWIDRRRDRSLTSDEALVSAPAAWKRWVRLGDSALETSRRRVFGASIRSPAEQRREATDDDQMVLQEIYGFFNSNAYQFEGMASWMAGRVLGPTSSRGWVTPRIDGGIDFVSRLDLGSGFSKTVVVVLGQAKCIAPESSVRGIDLARTVARLRRGWIGVVVTTGTFSVRAQQELLADQYPLVLIDGSRVAQEVREEMVRTGIALNDLLLREAAWYEENQRMLGAERIAFGDHWGAPNN